MVKDVTEATFQAEVIDRSAEVPVVVDFWAEWCGPCRALTPTLEAAVAKRAGKVELAKVDTDANQRISQAFGIQGIPAVKAFKDGKVVDEFVGAQPPAQVERFFDALVPSEADELVATGTEESLRRALELEPNRSDAATALARILVARGETEEASGLLANATGFAAEGLAARLRVTGAEDPDPQVAQAVAALDAGDHGTGLDHLVGALTAATDKEDLRRWIVGILDELGVEHPLARETRKRLAAALY
jgi:putative thioredoxin